MITETFKQDFYQALIDKNSYYETDKTLKASWLNTKLGAMLAISDHTFIYLLEFNNSKNLERKIEKLRLQTKAAIIPGNAKPIDSIYKELENYFEGTLKTFKTPLQLLGSPFQKSVWQELLQIPYGQTRSYLKQAESLGKPSAQRAVANANGNNQIAIVIPCHRIIQTNGTLGGYAGGIERKKWLLEHEKFYTFYNH